MSREKSMKKKLAVALSVVNALNSIAPMALPYVNLTRDMSTRGGADVRRRSKGRPGSPLGECGLCGG